ncbi:ATP-binding response regulator [Paludibacterium purpuratum]|uniref:histidine kinase n=1 Tax=Paludibacterium purpuratum TaxID=1144873 RepID=A0A4R7B8G5_9NEIS|nr:ATP-binding protein [Paludibacterium purpuratum]TDR80172.1 signal transduction histidine kinase [Paludibacterium purpuratum]
MSHRFHYLIIAFLISIIMAMLFLMSLLYFENNRSRKFVVDAHESYYWQTSQLLISYEKLLVAVQKEMIDENIDVSSVDLKIGIFLSRVDMLVADTKYAKELTANEGFSDAINKIISTRNKLESQVHGLKKFDKSALQAVSHALFSIKNQVNQINIIGRKLAVRYAEISRANDRYRENQLRLMQFSVICCFAFLVISVLKLRWQQKKTKEQTRCLELAEKAKCIAESTSKAKSQFLATVSHELRSPLQAVLGAVSLLENTAMANQHSSIVGVIKESSCQLKKLVDDLIDLSGLENRQLKLNMAPFVFFDWRMSIFESLRPHAELKKLEFYSCSENVPDQIIFDRERLSQIVSNLVLNAIKFTDVGFVKVEYSFVMELPPRQGLLLLKVSDTGCGVADVDADAIFEPFTQLSKFETSKDGMGLGLAIVANLVRLAHGTISMTSHLGTGSVFCVSVPVEIPVEETARSLPLVCETLSTAHASDSLRILLVDDDAALRMVMSLLVKDMGYECHTASNGQEALNLIEQNNYAAIVTDIQMPVMNGYELAKKIRVMQQFNIPVIAITAFPQSFVDENGSHLFDEVLYKPIEKQDLERVLQSLIAVTWAI